jgi:eukaryotic-like serine/threonine-protein kinase
MTERTGAVDGRRLGGRYRMEALLATGGMGEVWAARDLLLDRAVAVKVLGGALAGDGRAAERLRREARAAARLDHPNIARVLDLGEHDGRPYLVMELLEGESLAARIDLAGPLPAAEAARIVAAVADALEAAHQAGVVHRDVKPGNVFLTTSGEVKVLDFGIARSAHDTALTTGDLLGTAAYLAPERVLGDRATPAADIYALGVVLYELLAGHRPFAGDSEVELAMAHVNADPPLLDEVASTAPPSLVAACHQALAKDPASRPASAAEFARLVRTPVPAPGTTRPLPVSDASGANPLPVAGAAPSNRRSRAGTAIRPPSGRPPSRRRRPGSRRRGLLVALLLAGALLAALPTLSGGLPLLVRDRIQGPFGVLDPGGITPGTEAPGSGSVGTDAVPDPGAEPTDAPGPPSFVDPGGPGGDDDRRFDRRDDDRDPDDDDSSGSGRSGGGGSSGPG